MSSEIKLTTAQRRDLFAKLKRGAEGKSLPRLSRVETTWLFNYLTVTQEMIGNAIGAREVLAEAIEQSTRAIRQIKKKIAI